MWSNERFSSISTTTWFTAARLVPSAMELPLLSAGGGFMRRGPRCLGHPLVRMVFPDMVQYGHSVGMNAARHRVEQRRLAAGRDGLIEGDDQLIRVGILVVAGERQQVGRHPGDLRWRRFQPRRAPC